MGWLRLKMATPVVASLALLAVAVWLVLGRICQENVAAAAREAIRGAGSAFYETMKISAEDMGAVLGALTRDHDLAAAVAARDHRRILALAGPMYRDLRTRHGITHWNYWEVEGPGSAGGPLRNIIRLGTPAMHGDYVERATLSRVSREKALVTGLELGYTGFVLRALAPVRHGGRLVGYAELGREIGSFLGDMKARTGDDYALVLDKRFVDPRRWASARLSRGERNDWADREDLLLIRDTTHGSAAFAETVLPDELPDRGLVLEVRHEGPRALARGAFPVEDASGRKVGAVFVLRDVTSLVKEIDRLRSRMAAVLGAAMIGIAVVIGAAFEVLVIRPRRASTER